MEKDLNKKIENFLKGGTWRCVTFKSHCHGIRAELYEDFKEVISDINVTAEAAFDGALSDWDVSIKARKIRELNAKIKRASELETELSLVKKQIIDIKKVSESLKRKV